MLKTFYEGKYLELGTCDDQWILIPTISYNPKKSRYSWTRPVDVLFLNFYALIGKERG